MRHLVCFPYSIPNLHAMAKALNIHPCWFHASKGHEHYDIPKRRVWEIARRTEVVSPKMIMRIISGEDPGGLPTSSLPEATNKPGT